MAHPEKSEHRRKAAAGTLANYIGTIFNLFLYWEFFKKKYQISQEKGWPRSTRSTLIPPMYTNDSQIYIILNPVARREELLCWVVGWAGEQKHTCIACELPLVLFRVGTSCQAVSRKRQATTKRATEQEEGRVLMIKHFVYLKYIYELLTLGINPTCDWAWAFNSSAAWFWSTLTWTVIIQTRDKLGPVHKNQDIFETASRVEPRFNEGPRDWKNLFAIKRFRYIEVLFHIFYYY